MKKSLKCLLTVIFAISLFAVCIFQSSAADVEHQYTDADGNVYTYTVVKVSRTDMAYISNIEIKSSGTHLIVPETIDGCTVRRILGISPETAKNLVGLTFDYTSLEYIGESAFAKCENLKEVHFSRIYSSCIIDDNAFYNLKSLETVTFAKVTSMTLGENAFADCHNLKQIDFGDSLGLTIKDGCFKGAGITELTIPGSPKLADYVYLGRYVFSECKNLVKADISASPLNRILYTVDGEEDKSAFKNYEYSQGLFAGCTALQEVKISNYSKIYEETFRNCSSLKKYDIGTAQELGRYAFSGCASLEYFDFSKISKMDSWSFYGCSSLKSIDISNFKSIPVACFENCTSLTELDLTGVETIGNAAFAGCTGLKSLTFDHDITIGHTVFENCTGLEEIIIGDDVSRVDNNGGQSDIFKGCTNIKYIYIGKSFVPKYKSRSWYFLGTDFFGFGNLSGLETIEVSPDNPDYRVVDGALYVDQGDYYVLLCYPAARKGTSFSTEKALANVSKDFTIGEYAFAGSKYLKEVNITKPVVYPDFEYDGYDDKRYDFLNYSFAGSSIEKVTFPKGGLNTVGPHMFEDSAIRDIDLSNTKIVLKYAFSNCTNLGKIDFSSMVEIWDYAFSGCTTITELNFPSCIEDIREGAFQKCTSLKIVNFPEGVAIWSFYGADYAFAYCTALETVNMPSGEYFEKGVFYGCTALVNVYAPNCKEIYQYAFAGCVSLKNIDLPQCTYIGSYAFKGCASLESVDAPKCQQVEAHAFEGLTSLKDVNMTRCTYVGEYAFAGCTSLESMKLFRNIKKSAFENCTSLKYVVLHEVHTIGDNAFKNCPSLILVSFDNTNCTFGEGVFEGCTKLSFYCDEASTAYTYAIEHNIPVIAVRVSLQDDKYTYTYSGSEIRPGIIVSMGDMVLVPNRDYILIFENNINAGTATVTVRFIGDFEGLPDAYRVFSIVRADVRNATVKYDKEYYYNGEDIKLDVVVELDGRILVRGVDYSIYEYPSNEILGIKRFAVRGMGNYTGAVDFEYTVMLRNISDATVEYVKDNDYNGEDIRPAVVVKIDGKTLVEGVDYTVTYSDKSDAGTMFFTITGIGYYTGSQDFYYNIIRRDIAEVTVSAIPDCVYTGSELCPIPTLTWNGFTLEYGVDYDVQWLDNIDTGFGTMVIYGKGNFNGAIRLQFRIFGKDISSATVSAIADQEYTGNEIRPKVTVTVDGKTLTENVDYTVEYRNNTESGTASVIISGMGNYSGVTAITFRIYKNSVYGFTVFSETQMTETYDGTPLKPEMEVYFGTERLVEGVDYEIRLENNISAGTATVTVIGIGRFEGERSYNFTILPCEISEKDISVSGSLEFNGAPVEPKITVTKNGTVLENGKDYIVTYHNNNGVGTAYVTVEGIGNYCSIVNLEYEIYKTDEDDGKNTEPETPDTETPDNSDAENPPDDKNKPSKDDKNENANRGSENNGNVNNGTENAENKPQTPSAEANSPSKENNGTAAPQIPNTDMASSETSVCFAVMLVILMGFGVCDKTLRKKSKTEE